MSEEKQAPDYRPTFLYAAWRLDMWLKGYGSYTQIDNKVVNEELEPGKSYPSLREEPSDGK